MVESKTFTILAVEGPILRAYVSALRNSGIRPQRVITIAPRSDQVTRKQLGRWLPRKLRTTYALRINEARQNYWPRRLKHTEQGLVAAMSDALVTRFSFFNMFFDALEGPANYQGWTDKHDVILADGLGDPAVANALVGAGTVLFTGGGRVPASLLAVSGLQFLHIHPGLMPYIRGADGLLWSTLVRNRHGRTGFQLTSSLDDGPIFAADEMLPMRFVMQGKSRPADQILYRALYSYYDPCFRAELAASLIGKKLTPRTEDKEDHSASNSFVFPFMSGRLRAAALSQLFFSR